jgi:hypothetical protein
MQFLPPALLPLGAWPQWVVWIAVPHPDKPGKFNKFPVDWQTGDVVDAHDPQFWTSAACALAMAPQWDRGFGSGGGFVFTDADPFFFADMDTATAWTGADWTDRAKDFCQRLAGVAVEVSHSGTGLHWIGTAAKLEHRTKNTLLGLELYTSRRFVALTGHHASGNANHDATVPLAAMVAEFFPPLPPGQQWEGWTTEPVAEYTGPAEDDELIRRAVASSQRTPGAVFGGAVNPNFNDLWTANADALAPRWPGEGTKAFGQSEADQALANMLAFWTGKNCERMERLMRRSALARDKWDVHRTYLADTILKACGFVEKVYTHVEAPAAPLIPIVAQEAMAAQAQQTGRKLRAASSEYMGPFEQLEFFDGCFWDAATDRIYSVKRNSEYNKSRFDVVYGGHMFIMDPANQKTSDSAWDAFTKSRVNEPAIVDALCFRPEHPPGALVHDGARIYANAYVPYQPKRVKGDPSKFLNHLAKMLPDEHDRKILLSYMASLAQNPGRKFQWWPVIQGDEGNGKSLIGTVLTHAVGQEYTHQPNAHALAREGTKFNSWLYRKLLIVIEEIMLSHKRDFLDEFKIVVTGERAAIERKGQDQFNADNRANGILLTNHRDGVPITFDSRRYSIFFCAQQPNDGWQHRDGMGEAYFADLVDWLKGRGAYAVHGIDYGCAVMADHLLSMEIEAAYDPARLSLRAPKTSSTERAVMVSMGRAEQEIIDAIEEGRPGFAGGWVSSKYLDILLDQVRATVPRSKRRDMMRALGYDWHPGLVDGRVNDVVSPDSGKPRLYLRKGHIALALTSPAEIARAYSRAQDPTKSDDKPAQSAAMLVFKKPEGNAA